MDHEESRVNQARMDMLKELANIGVGNAATSLSQMLEEARVDMEVPEVKLEELQEVPEHLGDPESAVGGVYFEAQSTEEDINLVCLFVLPLDSVKYLILKLLPGWASDASDIDVSADMGEMEISMLREVGNIVAGGYLSALSFITGLTFLPSPPQLAVDMSGAIVGAVIAETRLVDDKLILLKTTIHSAQHSIEGNVLILPDEGSLERIFKLMGVE